MPDGWVERASNLTCFVVIYNATLADLHAVRPSGFNVHLLRTHRLLVWKSAMTNAMRVDVRGKPRMGLASEWADLARSSLALQDLQLSANAMRTLSLVGAREFEALAVTRLCMISSLGLDAELTRAALHPEWCTGGAHEAQRLRSRFEVRKSTAPAHSTLLYHLDGLPLLTCLHECWRAAACDGLLLNRNPSESPTAHADCTLVTLERANDAWVVDEAVDTYVASQGEQVRAQFATRHEQTVAGCDFIGSAVALDTDPIIIMRVTELCHLLDRVALDGAVIYFVANSHFLSLLDNAAASLMRLRINHFFVSALDAETAAHCVERGYAHIRWDVADMNDANVEGAYVERDGTTNKTRSDSYIQLTMIKISIAALAMAMRPGLSLLYLDTDIVVLQDPLEYILRSVGADPDVVFVLQGPCVIGSKEPAPNEVNTGVMYMRGRPEMLGFLHAVLALNQEEVLKRREMWLDQALVEKLLLNAAFKWATLDALVAPVSCVHAGPFRLWHLGVGLWPMVSDVAPVLVHMNLSPSSRKVEAMQRAGLWLLDATGHADESWLPPLPVPSAVGGATVSRFARSLGRIFRDSAAQAAQPDQVDGEADGTGADAALEAWMHEASEGDCFENWQDEMLKMNRQTWVAGGGLVSTGLSDST
jgi:hypothetical protein